MIIEVTVNTRSRRRHLEKVGVDKYRAYITEIPEGGKANTSLIKLLSKELGLAKNRLKIIKGMTSKRKIIKAE